MNRCWTFWRCVILLFFKFFIQRVRPVSCLPYQELCHLTVEPSSFFYMGANLTVHCHLKTCHRGFRVSLELNTVTVKNRKEINCTQVMFRLANMRTPQSYVHCKLKSRHQTKIGCGQDLHGGLPPPKPENIMCETTRAWDFIHCSWHRSAGIYLPTTYRLSVHSENGTLVYSNQTQEAEEMTIPRRIVDNKEKYQIDVTAQNPLGSSRSDPLRLFVNDIVIPDTPNITHIEFESSPIAAVLRWNTSDSYPDLQAFVRLHTPKGSWEMTPQTELGEGLIRVHDLMPLTEYWFQVKMCDLAQGRVCSRWSSAVTWRSPGKRPSRRLCVWRTLISSQMVSVLWKPPPPDDYSGEVREYKVLLAEDGKELATCAATLSRCSVEVPAEDGTVSVSAVTSYGSTPPAPVPLRHSGASGPILRESTPASGGGAVFVSWSRPGIEHRTTGELLHYVVEWISVPATQLQWQRVERNQDNTTITGLSEGVRYNMSVYAVTTGGVSAPSSDIIYSKQLKPASGPILSVLSHESRRVLIQWVELPVDQRRGFIIYYNLYIHTLDSINSTPHRVELSGSGSRHIWMDCPDGALTLQLTASTSAGEGPGGPQVVSQPAAPAVSLIIVVVFIIVLFIAVTANLMCWGCVRKKIKQKCVSCGPAWLVETLPKPGNSNAIRLLQQGEGEPSFFSTDSDPLLSPISLVSSLVEKDFTFPSIQVEVTDSGSGQPSAETPSSALDTGRSLVDRQLDDSSYKPQISVFPSKREEEVEEESVDGPVREEEVVCSFVIEGLLGVFLSRVDVDLSDSNLSSTFEVLRPNSSEGTEHFLGGDLVEGKGTEVKLDCAAVETQQQDGLTPDMANTCSSQNAAEAEAALTGGYFPQLASFCDVGREVGLPQKDLH